MVGIDSVAAGRNRPRLVVGLTGGIGSGKTTVANRFAGFGIPVIDTDEIAHELVEPGMPALDAVAARFGPEVITADGALDRARLRELVFRDLGARKDLEAILHPPIRVEVRRRLAGIRACYAVVVIPLLVETTQHDLVDRILVVDLPERVQVHRVMRRSDLDEETVVAILRAQCSRRERLAEADDIIDNGGDVGSLCRQVDRLHQQYMQLSGATAVSSG